MLQDGAKLIGIHLVSSGALGTYRISNLYRPALSSVGKCVVVSSGLDARQHIGYPRIEKALSAVYAPWIKKVWHRKHTQHNETYFQFHKHASPSAVGLVGRWRLWSTL